LLSPVRIGNFSGLLHKLIVAQARVLLRSSTGVCTFWDRE
jgi:hypothetical protein